MLKSCETFNTVEIDRETFICTFLIQASDYKTLFRLTQNLDQFSSNENACILLYYQQYQNL